ncbi:hypothetical protein MPTK1_5g16660 [Marchantia polymorpha subsp. ruderalis]|uniref:4Fe-4S ferredoxin-type domain-containing protein n=2 Tax=Marchantia polymorpha TaxID=3197 RepID=A0AAF6BJ13_MARPO|nr:hypothetical protein MARPO_0117s0040 [Marchantia polymorpha]BBN11997.1 hypothetical protein Mp_5g16660 [Marchantia polymorpha subsp. ruderalis]|eukprot:PTQ30986.1 hypothetical protein MARPO_0117s0040 [Marchantia polymorpha]
MTQMTAFIAYAILLTYLLTVKAELIVSPALKVLRGRNLLNVTPAQNTCKFNSTICSEPNSAGSKCCDEVCVDTSSDENNCGSCGRDCSFGKTCCDGDCVDLQKDEDNCGRCGLKCPKTISINNLNGKCENGLCDYN